MIPRLWIAESRQYAPWPDDGQTEQDLVIGRAPIELQQELPANQGKGPSDQQAESGDHLDVLHRN